VGLSGYYFYKIMNELAFMADDFGKAKGVVARAGFKRRKKKYRKGMKLIYKNIDWKEMRNKVRKASNGKCVYCGERKRIMKMRRIRFTKIPNYKQYILLCKRCFKGKNNPFRSQRKVQDTCGILDKIMAAHKTP
jgi:hypothetical protein